MSDRRRARAKFAPTKSGQLPAHLMIGPCLEDWPTVVVSEYVRPESQRAIRGLKVRRAWEEAVRGWATDSGWASDARPADNALSLARTRRPWSREYLLAAGRPEVVAYYEGRTDKRPTFTPWGRTY